EEAEEDGRGPDEVAGEVERVRAQSLALVTLRRSQRDDGADRVDDDDSADDADRPEGGNDAGLAMAHELQPRATGDEEARGKQEPRLAEGGEVLGLPVPVRMAAVGGSRRDDHGKERQDRGDEVRPRVHGLREEAEAVGLDRREELHGYQRGSGRNGHQRG